MYATVYSNPFHDVDIFRQHDDSLEVTLDKSCLYEWTAEVERLLNALSWRRSVCGRSGISSRRGIWECGGGWRWRPLWTPWSRALHRASVTTTTKKKKKERYVWDEMAPGQGQFLTLITTTKSIMGAYVPYGVEKRHDPGPC